MRASIMDKYTLDKANTLNVIMDNTCSLCNQNEDLKKSHIIPNFIGKWFKENSSTGFMVKAENASNRVQGLPTSNLLCDECEGKFSTFEKYFSEKIFYPFHEQKIRSFEYDSNLELFLISVSWRVLKMQSEDYKLKEPQFSSHLDKAELDWREFLLGKRQSISPYENHLCFLDYVENAVSMARELNWYNLHSIDCSIVGNSERVWVYVKFPWMFFVSSINPTKLDGWEGTEIKEKGTITTGITIKDGIFGEFLVDRAKLALHSSEPIPEQLMEKRLKRALEKNPDRYFGSEAFRTQIADRDLKLKEKMKHLPKSVASLFDDIIAKSVEDPNLSKADNQVKMWETRMIAEAIASLSNEEANDLNTKILGSIQMSKILQKDYQITIEANPIWITFMIEVNSSKEQIQTKIIQEIERLRKKNNDEKLIAVFAMAIRNGNFESGFLIPPSRFKN